MIISTKFKFVLLSNRKCGSTSLVHSIDHLADIIAQKDHRLRHTSYLEYQQFVLPWLRNALGEEADSLVVLSLFREPLEWLYSWYRFRRTEDLQQKTNPDFSTSGVSWKRFLKVYASTPVPTHSYARVGKQHDFVCDENGNFDAIKLFAYDDFASLVAWLEARTGQGFDIKSWNVSDTLHQKPDAADYAFAREHMAKDYEIYDAIKNQSAN